MPWKRGASPAPLCQLATLPLGSFLPPSRPSPRQRREKPYCSPHLCLSHPSLWSACLLAYLNPVSGNKTSPGSDKSGANKRLCALRAPRPRSLLAALRLGASVITLLTAVETMQRHLLRMYLEGTCTRTAWVGKKSNCSRHPFYRVLRAI